ncbi:Profilin [Chionoecetes opilio]|uniref:Profilin n=1 Tax=Chionoecetes opilio TaxID=41210 RepID=A0A8J4YNC9_CHIOP|nr:Profilin [Chionoecetes opilio]
MSWQNYVDQQLMGSGLVAKAVIAGHDGTLWAKSNNIEPTREELVKLSSSFSDQANLAMSGVHIGGEKFFYLSGTDKVIRCKKGKSGMHSMKTLQTILVAVFEEPIQHPQVASVVESLGDYLISMSY